ncbi:uncharacterized protein HKW66_Vig0194650 [Vigna angularis]|uniref:Hydroxyproline-rich glycoprotein family protein n=1 Tax=Phaseolus angularis TaxID=3914 RepID=A0A8T0KQS4_PHAAN|nr:uncharacterized protein HKW66_Vig0194650 [Vigna angularis]
MNEREKKKHVREAPSVPFIWEVKPGIAKKHWKPETEVSSVAHFPQTPLKLIASVPFLWEEKPGKPLPNFSDVSVHPVLPKPEKILIHVASSSCFSVACNFGHDGKDKGTCNYDSESITSLDLEAFTFDADQSFGSVPSLLSNCVVPSEKASSSSPASSETDSSISSYATGRSSPIGATFLETLFPLYARDQNLEKETSSTQEVGPKDFCDEDIASDIIRRPPTLGELIMMSRRRSCRRKTVQMNKWDPPKVITQFNIQLSHDAW